MVLQHPDLTGTAGFIAAAPAEAVTTRSAAALKRSRKMLFRDLDAGCEPWSRAAIFADLLANDIAERAAGHGGRRPHYRDLAERWGVPPGIALRRIGQYAESKSRPHV
jgi:hypothetical protein